MSYKRIKGEEKILITAHPYSLRQGKHSCLNFCWYYDAGPDFLADFRDDGLIYISGFDSREKAVQHGVNQGWIEL